MNLSAWAIRHHVGADALADLRRLIEGATADPRGGSSAKSEAGVVSRVRLEASQKGVRLFRNNVGAAAMPDGTFLRYGLANDSSQLNQRLKSADLIGVRPILVTPAHLGHTIGQFVSRECKAPGWRYSGTGREAAQNNWALLIASLGGDAAFCDGPGTL